MSTIDAAELEALLGGERSRPLVFATVGSDHHRFDRLVSWLDRWSRDRDVDCIVQSGTASPPEHARAIAYVDRSVLLKAMGSADLVVVQGGPMSIIEARREGSRPVVVPRIPSLDEVVDSHQVTFCRKLASQGLIDLAETETELRAELDAALADPDSRVVGEDLSSAGAVSAAIDRFARVADQVAGTGKATLSPTVLLLGGSGRSGSTLLERILGETTGVTTLGETVHLWERGLRDDELCGCGESFWSCPFWKDVGERAFGGWDSIDVDEAVALRADVVRTRRAAELLGPAWRVGWRLRRDRLGRSVRSLYAAAAETSGAQVLVDSSKHPAYAMLLRRLRLDLRCVLVVRDPRAVAYAWSRAVRRPEIVGRDEEMPRYGAVYSAAVWQAYAAIYLALGRLGVPLLVVRYEDLVERPSAVVDQVRTFAGLPGEAPSAQLEQGRVDLSVGHTVAGNPMRFTTGRVEIRPDDRWRDGLPRRDAALVTAVTAWGRRRFGYA